MKKLKQYIISIFLIALLINAAGGFPQGGTGNRTAAQPDLNDTTESDQDIQLLQHLIEVDTLQFQSENRLYVRETLIFKNSGQKNFSGTLRTWVPDGVEGIRVGRVEMRMDVLPEPIQIVQNGNIISWQDSIERNSPLPPLYAVEYVLKAEPEGIVSKSKYYSKKLLYPTFINKAPGSVILKVTKNQEDSVTVTDEKGNSISASGSPKEEEDGSILYGWVAPEFKEIYIEISKPAATPAGLAGYVILGLLIMLVLSYPVLRKKSEKVQAIEERIRNSIKREPEENSEDREELDEETAEETEEGTEEETEEEISEEPATPEEDAEFSGKTKDELETEKNEMHLRLDELEKNYASGDMLDEEYEELRNSYQAKIDKITEMIERSD